MNNKKTKPGKAEDRRVGNRRITELDPPHGWMERRLCVEKRKPEVAEGSLEEWEELMGKSHAPASSETQDEPVLTDWEGLRHL